MLLISAYQTGRYVLLFDVADPYAIPIDNGTNPIHLPTTLSAQTLLCNPSLPHIHNISWEQILPIAGCRLIEFLASKMANGDEVIQLCTNLWDTPSLCPLHNEVTLISPCPTAKQCHLHVWQPQVGAKFLFPLSCVYLQVCRVFIHKTLWYCGSWWW